MFGKRKSRRRKRAKTRPRLTWLIPGRRRLIGWACVGAVIVTAAWAAGSAASQLEAHVHRQIRSRVGDAVVAFIDLPDALVELASADLHGAVADLKARPWTDDHICRDMALRLVRVGWIRKVRFVRRAADARFEISAEYRLPEAMVQHGGGFYLVDGGAVRLPGKYRYAPAWQIVQGVREGPPPAGVEWPGEDVRAGLDVIRALEGEAFSGQITGVLVDNVGGRIDSARCHVELATDRAGGRIRWGSAPGMEIEENTVGQKIAILRANYRETGRADANQPVIDVSTFPDRFTIPG